MGDVKAPTLTVQNKTHDEVKKSGVLAKIGEAALHLGSEIEGGGLNMLVVGDLKAFSNPEGTFIEVQQGEDTLLCSDGERSLCWPGDWAKPILDLHKEKNVAVMVKAAAPKVEEAEAGPE